MFFLKIVKWMKAGQGILEVVFVVKVKINYEFEVDYEGVAD